MFVERDTGARNYFEVPLVRSYEIFTAAYRSVSGLSRSVRGPCMSAFPGNVRVLGLVSLRDMMDINVIESVRDSVGFDILGDPRQADAGVRLHPGTRPGLGSETFLRPVRRKRVMV